MPLHLLDNLANLSSPESARNALDLGTGDSPQFDSITLTSGGTITGNVTLTGNLTASGIISSPDFNITGVSGAELSISKSVTTWEYGTKTLLVQTQATTPTGIDFNDTGTKAFIVNATAGALNVFQYDLSTPWDLATGSYSTIFKSVSGADTAPRGIKFSRDGLYMFIVGDTNNSIYRYTLTNPWDLNTVSLNPTETLSLVPLVGTLTAPQGVDFSLDGRKMYVANSFNNFIFEFNLVNPWVLTGATYSGNSLSVNAAPVSESGLQDVVVSSDGNRLFIIGSNQDRVYEYTLPTPYSLAGAFFHGAMRVSTSGNNTLNMVPIAAFSEGTPNGLYYNDILNKCFFIGQSAFRIQEIIVNSQILLIGERPIIRATGSSLGVGAGSVRINSLRITDTTAATSNDQGGQGALIVAGGIGASGITVAGAIVGSSLRVDSTGTIAFNTRSIITSPVNGDILLRNTAGDNFNRLNFGIASDSFPALVRNGTGFDIRTGGATAGFSDLRAKNITAAGPIIFQNTTVAGAAAYSGAGFIGAMLYISDEVGGATMAFYDGTNWRRVQDRAIISPLP